MTTPRQLALDAIAHRQPARVPYDIQFTREARRRYAEFCGDADFEGTLGNCFSIARVSTRVEVRPDIWQDEFGTLWDRSRDKDIGVVVNRLVGPENVSTFRLPDPDDPAAVREVVALQPRRADTLLLAKLSYNLFERAWALAGMEEVLMAMAVDKPFVHALLDRLTEYYLALIEAVTRRPVDGIFFGDDWGTQTGVIMGPALWREFLLPRVRKLYAAVKDRGALVVLHCCGAVQELLPELIDAGLDVFNPFQPEVMDVFEMKRRHGERLTFYGGVSTQRTLPFASPQQTADEVRRLVREIGAGGGYIASPAHAIPADARPENIAAMIEALRGP